MTMAISAEDVMANLRAMLDGVQPKVDVAPPASPAVAFVKEMAEFVSTPVNDPEAFKHTPNIPQAPGMPDVMLTSPGVAKSATIVAVAAKSTVTQQVVVLDDGSTYSDLEGCKICEIPMDSTGTFWTLTEESYAAGISISDLLTLRDALLTIRHILG